MLKNYLALAFLACMATLFYSCEREKKPAEDAGKQENVKDAKNGMQNQPQNPTRENYRS